MNPPKNILGMILAAAGVWLLWRMLTGAGQAAVASSSSADPLGRSLTVAGPTIIEAPSALPTALQLVLDKYSSPHKVFLETGEGSLYYAVEKPFDPYDNKLINPSGVKRP